MKTIKKQKVRMANNEERKYWDPRNEGGFIIYVVDRKTKNSCGETKNIKIWCGTDEEFYTKFNVMTEESYNTDREKTYKRNF